MKICAWRKLGNCWPLLGSDQWDRDSPAWALRAKRCRRPALASSLRTLPPHSKFRARGTWSAVAEARHEPATPLFAEGNRLQMCRCQ